MVRIPRGRVLGIDMMKTDRLKTFKCDKESVKMDTTALYRTELLQVAEAVAREKAISSSEVLEAMEQAISRAGRAKYGHEHDIRATIDRKTGEVKLHRYTEVVEQVENEFTQMLFKDARVRWPENNLQLGDFKREELPPIDLGRIAAQSAKQVIVQKVREAERGHQFEEFKDRVGEIINGVVKRSEFGNVTVDLGGAEAIMRRDETLPRENYRNGDRIRAYIYDVREEQRGPQIFLSRSHPQFMAKLFAQEVPEIYDGVIEIKSVARDPGSRAKIAVLSNESSIDPVGACVGLRGSRVQAIVTELQGEKVDIIPWSEDVATYVVNSLAPAEVSKVVLDEDAGRIEVVIPDEQLSLAIGRRGQNVRLASILTAWDIDILTEEEESRRRQDEMRQRSQLFMDVLDVDDVIAHLLVAEGFVSIEQVGFVPVDELSSIEGFDDEVAEELRNRARDHLDSKAAELEEARQELGLDDAMLAIEGITDERGVKLGEQGVKTRDDLADLAADELIEFLGPDLAPSTEEANAIIMAARAHWFEDDDAPAENTAEASASENKAD